MLEGWACGSGVVGVVGSVSIFMAESFVASASGAESPRAGESWEEVTVSTDWLRDGPPREWEVRRRFRDDILLSSKGLGRVEAGSEETARSLESSVFEA